MNKVGLIGIILLTFELSLGLGLGSVVGSVVTSVQDTVTVATTAINETVSCLPLGDSLTPSPDANLTTPQIINKYGYKVEVFTVTTSDGYILTLFRIPSAKNGTAATRGPVLLQHGLLCSSAAFLMNTPEKSLPFLLSEKGYDVWIGNARGTSYSLNHTTLDTNSFQYWNFSWHEMGKYDIPAVIDTILEETGFEKLFFIGHSMGTTMFFVTMSLLPEYNDKIRLMYALAPAAYMKNMTSPLLLLAPLANEEELVFQELGHGEFLPSSVLDGIHSVGPILCGPAPLALAVCGSAFFAIAGIDPCQFNTTEQVSNIVGHTPDSISSRTIVHYLQLKNSGLFTQYDYGLKLNMEIYQQAAPPEYNLSLITAPIVARYALNDILSVPSDVRYLLPQLPNLVSSKVVDFSMFNHLDFLFAKDINNLVNNDVLNTLSSY